MYHTNKNEYTFYRHVYDPDTRPLVLNDKSGRYEPCYLGMMYREWHSSWIILLTKLEGKRFRLDYVLDEVDRLPLVDGTDVSLPDERNLYRGLIIIWSGTREWNHSWVFCEFGKRIVP